MITPPNISLLLADDHAIMRKGLALFLEQQPDMQVIAQADNGQEAVTLYRQYAPDVALLDLRMPILGGVEALTAIRAEFPAARVILLTTYDTDEDIYRGAAGRSAGLSPQRHFRRGTAGHHSSCASRASPHFPFHW